MGKGKDVLNKRYPAKLILFGEYTVLLGSGVLALPLFSFAGRWSTSSSRHPAISKAFYSYLTHHASAFLDTRRLSVLFETPYVFESNIPRGCGLGSSGALTAAVYEFCISQQPEDFNAIQNQLAVMESFFHGKSSGLDPLVSLIGKGIHRSRDGKTDFISGDVLESDTGHIRLLDSRIPRRSSDLIPQFFRIAEKYPGKIAALSELTSDLILASITGLPWADKFREISRMQLELLNPMIPAQLRVPWEEGLHGGAYYLKLCGSGGGGFFMCYVKGDVDAIGGFPILPISFRSS